jgi:hypothetical protein
MPAVEATSCGTVATAGASLVRVQGDSGVRIFCFGSFPDQGPMV